MQLMFFLLALHLPLRDVWLQAAVEVEQAHDSVDDGEDDEDNGQDGEGGQRAASGLVICNFARVAFVVHADTLEEKVCEGGKVECLVGFRASADV